MLLRDIMTEAGFEPISTEWWHFDLADDPHPDMSFDFPVSAESVAR
jgi:D-alanyl-D-alanine dipeptidase